MRIINFESHIDKLWKRFYKLASFINVICKTFLLYLWCSSNNGNWIAVPPQWTVSPGNTSVVLGNTVWLDCAAVGFPAPNILWKKMIYTGTWMHFSSLKFCNYCYKSTVFLRLYIKHLCQPIIVIRYKKIFKLKKMTE